MLPGVGGAVFDEDDMFSPEGGAASALELDVRVMPAAAIAPLRLQNGREPVLRYGPPERFPHSRAAAGSEPTADEAEASALADYGDGPRSFWQAPLYAYRVKTRQSEIRRQLAERQKDLSRARQAEEEAKVAFAERVRPAAQKIEVFAKLLEPIVVTEKIMLERDSALEAAMDAHEGQLRVIDARIDQLEADLARAKLEERQIEDKLAEAEAVRRRAEAKVKRAEIEIRNVGARVDVEGGGARAPARGVGTPP